jgi:hypothetical protein
MRSISASARIGNIWARRVSMIDGFGSDMMVCEALEFPARGVYGLIAMISPGSGIIGAYAIRMDGGEAIREVRRHALPVVHRFRVALLSRALLWCL